MWSQTTAIPNNLAGSTVTFKVTAKAGTTLRYLCIIHPWMQGSFKVK